MHLNAEERSAICKVCFWGPPGIGKGELLEGLYSHFSSSLGEHTSFSERSFDLPAVLEERLGDEAASVMSAASESMGVPYEDLANAGELVFFRTRVVPGDDQRYAVYIDSYTVSGAPESDALRDFTLGGADAVVFVADGVDEEATMASWSALHERAWNGPTVLLIDGVNFTEEVEEWLGFDGRSFCADNGFEYSLEAFYAASEAAMKHAKKVN